MVDGDPVENILIFAQENGCDLIAMSTHGHNDVNHFFLGNVTEIVARRALCPLQVFPACSEHPLDTQNRIQEVH